MNWFKNKVNASRRGFLGGALGSVAGAAALGTMWADETVEAYQGNVRTASKPSDLKITDLRYAHVVGAPMSCPIIRIDTNQGLKHPGFIEHIAFHPFDLPEKPICIVAIPRKYLPDLLQIGILPPQRPDS